MCRRECLKILKYMANTGQKQFLRCCSHSRPCFKLPRLVENQRNGQARRLSCDFVPISKRLKSLVELCPTLGRLLYDQNTVADNISSTERANAATDKGAQESTANRAASSRGRQGASQAVMTRDWRVFAQRCPISLSRVLNQTPFNVLFTERMTLRNDWEYSKLFIMHEMMRRCKPDSGGHGTAVD